MGPENGPAFEACPYPIALEKNEFTDMMQTACDLWCLKRRTDSSCFGRNIGVDWGTSTADNYELSRSINQWGFLTLWSMMPAFCQKLWTWSWRQCAADHHCCAIRKVHVPLASAGSGRSKWQPVATSGNQWSWLMASSNSCLEIIELLLNQPAKKRSTLLFWSLTACTTPYHHKIRFFAFLFSGVYTVRPFLRKNALLVGLRQSFGLNLRMGHTWDVSGLRKQLEGTGTESFHSKKPHPHLPCFLHSLDRMHELSETMFALLESAVFWLMI